ncbi:MAG: IS1634 family transposase [Oligoflexia bacterium]|nr:IS1634 family transposase [Oligoflexia bacterium]
MKFKNIREVDRFNNGITDVFEPEYEQLNLFSNLTKQLPSTNTTNIEKIEEKDDILKSLVFARIFQPDSKRQTKEFLKTDFNIDIPLEKIYRLMDFLAKKEDLIKNIIWNRTLNILDREVDVMLFDVTTLYFESFKGDELKNFGFSKDCKFKEVQIVFALVTTPEGLPITYKTFPGNTNEGKTLIEIIKELKKEYAIKNITLVAGRAMFSKKNFTELEETSPEDKENLRYIIAAKLKSLSKKMKENILTDVCYTSKMISGDLCWIKEYEVDSRRLIVSYSSSRAKKDKSDRQRLVDRLLKKKNSKKLTAKDFINNNGTKKYIIVKGENEVEINEDKIKEDSLWDGFHGVITNIKDKGAVEILERYRSLWNIEAAFRVNKYDLAMRPIYHWKPNRIKAHILICFISYALVSYIGYKLKHKGLNISFEVLREGLKKVESTIVADITNKRKYVMPSKITEMQKKIYTALGLSKRTTPYCADKFQRMSQFSCEL